MLSFKKSKCALDDSKINKQTKEFSHKFQQGAGRVGGQEWANLGQHSL